MAVAFKLNRTIPERFQDVVSLSRVLGVYSTLTPNGDGTTTLTGVSVDEPLNSYSAIQIQGDDAYYTVLSTGEGEVVIKGDLAPLVDGYFYVCQSFWIGHEMEVASVEDAYRRLAGKKEPFYPLVWLWLNNVREYDTRQEGGAVEFSADITVFLVQHSDSKKRAGERYDENVKKVLFPLTERFINAMVESKLFIHSKKFPFFDMETEVLPRFGSEKVSNKKNTFNTVTDAMRLTFKGLRFAIEYDYC